MNYPFIFLNFTILFLFLYFFLLILLVFKNAFNAWKYTSNNDRKKKCTTAVRSEKMSVIPVIPLWHLAHIRHGCQHFRRAMCFPGVSFHPPHICLSLFFLSLFTDPVHQKRYIFKGRITFRNVWLYKTNQKCNFHCIFKTRR